MSYVFYLYPLLLMQPGVNNLHIISIDSQLRLTTPTYPDNKYATLLMP
ncbi:hypothetical protein SARI_00933 [Salmonella enterica subsp. arizonae serovar 62:z4,z23:-]|uniref:Uncharacterized protein n=1 Tax=Salmonella arizonae (strain ATCC BAA-731 / CDC346-86 / RSK2980) TaxID=41514 RepID=A9MMH7_SALAR|nr:hypothetical protein SARI_00933 [Salmonella enterica subsp. arizonae serovar 62:z4,z23:-]